MHKARSIEEMAFPNFVWRNLTDMHRALTPINLIQQLQVNWNANWEQEPKNASDPVEGKSSTTRSMEKKFQDQCVGIFFCVF